MITEDYVTHEIARLLEKKGFDGKCRNYIDKNSTYKDGYYVEKLITSNKLKTGETLLPTLQMAMKWLRKVHNIHIAIIPCEVGPGVMDYTYVLYKIDAKEFYFKDLGIQGRAENISEISYEKSCEAAIKYCLEHLI